MNYLLSFLAICFFVSTGIGQTINITGIVKDSAGNGVSGATVNLEQANVSTITKPNGSFTLSNVTSQIAKGNALKSVPEKIQFQNGNLSIQVVKCAPVFVSIYTTHGKRIARINKFCNEGIHTFVVPSLGKGIYIFHIVTGLNNYIYMTTPGSFTNIRTTVFNDKISVTSARQSRTNTTLNDILSVTKNGYLNYTTSVYNSELSDIEIKLINCADTVRDADGNLYHAVRIGNQVWTVENLRTTKYTDYTAIPYLSDSLWTSTDAPGYCYLNNTTNADSIKKYGALYKWYVADPDNPKKIAPKGWHVPNYDEWETLKNYLIVNGYNWDTTTTDNKIAKSLASRTDWKTSTTDGAVGNKSDLNNSTGFSALPGGCRLIYGSFLGNCGIWWSTSIITTSTTYFAHCYFLEADYSLLNRNGIDKSLGFSIRLIRD